jgi:acetoin utilization deacetylase AcuC-like enzyme
MKVVYHEDYNQVYSSDPASAPGRIRAVERNKGGCFGILEGGYNHAVLGKNVLAFVEGLSSSDGT